MGGCLTFYAEIGVELSRPSPVKKEWIDFGGGGRVGVRGSGSLCFLCDADSCEVTIQGCADARFRVWAFVRANGRLLKITGVKKDFFWEGSLGICSPPIKIPRFW